MGQEFTQGTAGKACVSFTMFVWGLGWKTWSWGVKSFENLFTYTSGGWCWLSAGLLSIHTYLNFLMAWWMGSNGEYPAREQSWVWKLHCLLWLASKVTQYHFHCILFNGIVTESCKFWKSMWEQKYCYGHFLENSLRQLLFLVCWGF